MAGIGLEYEYRYPHDAFDKADVLRRCGALLTLRTDVPPARLRRSLLVNRIYSPPVERMFKGGMVRLREEYRRRGRATYLLTFKAAGSEFEYESETLVEDAKAMRHVLLGIGCRPRHVIEKLREVVALPGGAEVSFDENPGLPCTMEVEAKSLAALKRLVKQLGLRPPTEEQRRRGRLETQYRELYGVEVDEGRKVLDVMQHQQHQQHALEASEASETSQPQLTFGSAAKALRAVVKRNVALFDSRLRAQTAVAAACLRK